MCIKKRGYQEDNRAKLEGVEDKVVEDMLKVLHMVEEDKLKVLHMGWVDKVLNWVGRRGREMRQGTLRLLGNKVHKELQLEVVQNTWRLEAYAMIHKVELMVHGSLKASVTANDNEEILGFNQIINQWPNLLRQHKPNKRIQTLKHTFAFP